MLTEWRPVPDYEGYYEVNEEGVIRRIKPAKGALVGSALKHRRDRFGYACVNLSKEGVSRLRRVHRIVLRAFAGEPEPGMVACHNDGDAFNPRLSNLRWDTIRNNRLDQLKHGTDPFAFKTHCKRGHAFDTANTYVRKDGGRECRACRVVHQAAYNERRRDALA